MPDDLLITGGQVPTGKVRVSGAKNSATRLLAAALLSAEPVRLRNFPVDLVDAKSKIRFMRAMGAAIDVNPAQSMVETNVGDLILPEHTDYDISIRTTYLLVAGQLIRNGVARIPYPGGCRIGSRGYDLHVMVWERMGCTVTEQETFIEVRGTLRSAEISFPISTVGGTENAIICASVATGITSIANAYITPEVGDLISLLQEMGVSIEVEGQSFIRVQGAGTPLRGASYAVMPDRIEALTWLVLAAVARGNMVIENVPFQHMEVPLTHVRHAGVDYFNNSESIYVGPESFDDHGIQPFELACGTHPGVISDMQALFAVLALHGRGISRVFDYRYPERIAYAGELARFCPGAINYESGKITIDGPAQLRGATVRSTDLRGSMALVLAAVCAKGESRVKDVGMAMRGYNNLLAKLTNLGLEARIESSAS